jgi:hypothetical protein
MLYKYSPDACPSAYAKDFLTQISADITLCVDDKYLGMAINRSSNQFVTQHYGEPLVSIKVGFNL